MNYPILISLAQNATLLLAMLVVFDLATSRSKIPLVLLHKYLSGIILGVLGIGLILASYELKPGIVFDTRSVLISVSGLFFGTIPTLILMGMTSLFRLWQGGEAAVAGTLVILCTGSVGLAWRHFRKGALKNIGTGELYLFGVVAHIIMLALMLTLRWDTAKYVLSSISIPVMIIYPVVSTLLGILLANRLRRDSYQDAIFKSEEKLRHLSDSIPSGIVFQMRTKNDGSDPELIYISAGVSTLLGISQLEVSNNMSVLYDLIIEQDREQLYLNLKECSAKLKPLQMEIRLRTLNNDRRWHQIKAMPQKTDASHILWDGLQVDITEQKQAADRLEALVKEKNELLELANKSRFALQSVAEDNLQAMKQLRKEKETLANLAITVPGALGIFCLRPDRNTNFEFVSPVIEDIIGLKPAELLRDATIVQKLYFEDDFNRIRSELLTSAKSLTPWNSEFRINHPEKGVVWIETRFTPSKETDGTVYWYGIILDITGRKDAEETLRRSEERWRTIIKTSPDGIALTDLEGNILEASDMSYSLFGFDPDEPLTHKTLFDFVSKEQHSDVRDAIGNILNEDSSGISVYELIRKDGSMFYAEVNGEVIRNNAGEPIQFVFILRNISDRLQAEQLLRQSEETYRNLFQNAQVGLFRTRISDGMIIESNDSLAEMFGYQNRTDIIGKLVISKNYVDHNRRSEMLEEIKTKGSIRNFVARFYSKKGHIIWINFSARIYPDQGWIEGVAENISARKKYEQELKIRLTFEHLQMRLLEKAIVVEDMEAFQYECMKDIGETLQVSRAYIFEYDPNNDSYTNTIEWCAPGIRPVINEMQDIAAKSVKWWSERLTSGKKIIFSNVDEVPDENSRTFLQDQDIKAVWVVPLFVSGKFYGFFGLDDCLQHRQWWSRDVSGILQSIPRILTDVIERINAEEALQKSEAFQKSIIECVPIPLLGLDTEAKVQIWNAAAERVFGWKAAEVIGKPNPVIPLERSKEYEDNLMTLKSGKHIFGMELKRKTKSGKILDISLAAAPVYNNQGRVVGIMATLEDITERKQAEARLRDSEERYRLLLESSMDAIMQSVPDGRILSANQAACEMFGMTEEEICSAGRAGLVDQSDIRVKELVDQRARHGRAQGEMTFIRADGTRFPAEVSSSIFYTSKGELRSSLIIRDITNRKKAEQELKESEERFKLYVNQAVDAIYVHDIAGRIKDVNNQSCVELGYSRDELLQMNILDIETQYSRKEGSKILAKLQPGFPQLIKSENRRKDGTVFPVEVQLGAFDFRGERLYMALVRDITERVEAENNLRILMNRLIESEEVMRKTAAEQLHDQVGQSLTALTLNLNYIKSQLPPMVVEKVFDKLEDSLELLNLTIEQIRNIMVELRPITLEDYGLHAALHWSIDNFKRRSGIEVHYTGHDLRLTLPVNIAYLFFRIAQEALHNILKHAAVSEVWVNLIEKGDKVKMTIKDDGIGFDPATLKNRHGSGGWGLPSIEERTKMLNGNMQIKSKPGHGTEISIEINTKKLSSS